jgi:hypothetical protein
VTHLVVFGGGFVYTFLLQVEVWCVMRIKPKLLLLLQVMPAKQVQLQPTSILRTALTALGALGAAAALYQQVGVRACGARRLRVCGSRVGGAGGGGRAV